MAAARRGAPRPNLGRSHALPVLRATANERRTNEYPTHAVSRPRTDGERTGGVPDRDESLLPYPPARLPRAGLVSVSSPQASSQPSSSARGVARTIASVSRHEASRPATAPSEDGAPRDDAPAAGLLAVRVELVEGLLREELLPVALLLLLLLVVVGAGVHVRPSHMAASCAFPVTRPERLRRLQRWRDVRLADMRAPSLVAGAHLFAVERRGARVVLFPDGHGRLKVRLRRHELERPTVAAELHDSVRHHPKRGAAHGRSDAPRRRPPFPRTRRAAHLHLAQLVVAPGVHLHGPHEAQVDAQAAVHAGALQAEENAIGDRRPLRVRVAAVEAFLGQRRAGQARTTVGASG